MSSVRLKYVVYCLFVPLLFILADVVLAGTTELTIRAKSGMKYDTLRFQVSPGEKLKIKLVNTDEIPHNIVFTRTGKRLEVVKTVEEMGAKAGEQGYAPNLEPIRAALPVIDGGEEKTLTFTAPEQPGAYPYVCTFPGHGYTMYGVMYVGNQDLPPLSEDPHVPDQHVSEQQQTETSGDGLNLPHAFPTHRPFVYRIKMPDATQASIAVALKNGQNYCWDAGRQRLRYVWKGGFVDPMPNFSGKGHETAEIKGDIYYRSKTFPLRIGSPDQKPQDLEFHGYRMIEGKPAFEVTMDGVRVQHYITSLPDGNGIVRRFRVQDTERPVWFVTNPEGDVTFSSPDGTFDGQGRLKRTPEQARSFRVHVKQSSSGGQE